LCRLDPQAQDVSGAVVQHAQGQVDGLCAPHYLAIAGRSVDIYSRVAVEG
jgi:hypothetical protein